MWSLLLYWEIQLLQTNNTLKNRNELVTYIKRSFITLIAFRSVTTNCDATNFLYDLYLEIIERAHPVISLDVAYIPTKLSIYQELSQLDKPLGIEARYSMDVHYTYINSSILYVYNESKPNCL